MHFLYNKRVYFWPITDFINVVVFTVSYSLITYKVRQQSKRFLRKQNQELYKKRISDITKVPKLIVATYIAFWVSSNLIKMTAEVFDYTIPLVCRIVINACYYVQPTRWTPCSTLIFVDLFVK